METIRVPPLEFLVWDVSGQERLRTFWRHYYHGTTGVVFVVDSHDVERLPIAKRELHGILKEEELNDAVLLIIANKTDLPNAVNSERLSQELDLPSLQGRVMHIQPAVAQKGTGLKEGLVWLAKAMKAHSKQQARLQQSAGSGAQANAVQPTSSYLASSTSQPAYNYDNPYDAQTINRAGSNSSTQQKQQLPQQKTAAAVAVVADRSDSMRVAQSTPAVQTATAVPMTVVAGPSSSSASTTLPLSSLTPVIVESLQSTSTHSSIEQRPPTGTEEQPGMAATLDRPDNTTEAATSQGYPAAAGGSSASAGDQTLSLTTSDAEVAPVTTDSTKQQ